LVAKLSRQSCASRGQILNIGGHFIRLRLGDA
jgi:hypothetical protein